MSPAVVGIATGAAGSGGAGIGGLTFCGVTGGTGSGSAGWAGFWADALAASARSGMKMDGRNTGDK